MTVNGKQFIVTHEMLTAVAREQRWSDVVAGILARFSKFAFVLFCYITNHLMAGPLRNSEFCFPRISMFPSTSSLSGNYNQPLSSRVNQSRLSTIFCQVNALGNIEILGKQNSLFPSGPVIKC